MHHSIEQHETDSNFGMVLTLWDRVFGTYVELPSGQSAPAMSGLTYFREPKDGNFFRLLCLPVLAIHDPAVVPNEQANVADKIE